MKEQLKIGWFEKNTKWLLLLPTIFILLTLTIYPLIYSVIAMLHTVNIRTGERTFVGPGNFIQMAKDPFFWNALKNTAIYTCSAVSVEFVIGLSLAVFLTTRIIGRNVFRSLILAPMMLPPIVVALIFKIIYNSVNFRYIKINNIFIYMILFFYIYYIF